MFLISFTYDFYCQGIEPAQEYCLVHANSYQEACGKIKEQFDNARDFKNLTL
jgi:hypothetical protein